MFPLIYFQHHTSLLPVRMHLCVLWLHMCHRKVLHSGSELRWKNFLIYAKSYSKSRTLLWWWPYCGEQHFIGTVLFQSSCARLVKRKAIFTILKMFCCDMAQRNHTSIASEVRMKSKDLFANFAIRAYCLHLGMSTGSNAWLLWELKDVMIDSGTWGLAIIQNQRPEASCLRTGLSPLMKSTCASQDSLARPSSSAWPTPFILSVFSPRSLSSLKQTGSTHWLRLHVPK